MKIKICDKCGHHNSVNLDYCEKCQHDITFNLCQEEKNEDSDELFVKCPGCGKIIPIKKGMKAVRCSEELCKKKFSVVGEDQIIRRDQLESMIEENGDSQSSDNEDTSIKNILMTNLIDKKIIDIPKGRYILGAKGDIEQAYFASHQFISSKHLIIEITDKKVYVTDTSRNHTYFKLRYIDNRLPFNTQQEVQDGDVLVLADQPFEVKFCR